MPTEASPSCDRRSRSVCFPPLFCAISPEGGRRWAGLRQNLPAQTCGHPTGNGQRAAMLRAARRAAADGQACGRICLHRRADIRRATASEQQCCELPVTAHGDAVSCAYRAIRLYEFMPPDGGGTQEAGTNGVRAKECLRHSLMNLCRLTAAHRRKRREYHGTFQRAPGRVRTGPGPGESWRSAST